MNEEVARLFRHVLPPTVAYVVAKGWIPADLQQPLVEIGIAVGVASLSWFASRKRDAARRKPANGAFRGGLK